MAKTVICFICKKEVRKELTIQLDSPAGKQAVCTEHRGVQKV